MVCGFENSLSAALVQLHDDARVVIPLCQLYSYLGRCANLKC